MYYYIISDMSDSLYLTISAMIGKSSALSSTYVISIYTAEIYPTAVR